MIVLTTIDFVLEIGSITSSLQCRFHLLFSLLFIYDFVGRNFRTI